MTHPDNFDLDRLRLAAGPARAAPFATKRPPRPRKGDPFLKGPIPWSWVETAAVLPGKALAVGLAVWREAGCVRSRTATLNLSRLPAGIPRRTAQRALRALEGAGLVAVARLPGHALRVTLLDAGDRPDEVGAKNGAD
jgi:hypothetical protein